MIRVVEDIFDEQTCAEIESVLLSKSFPWFFSGNIADENASSDSVSFGFCHTGIDNQKLLSEGSQFFVNIANTIVADIDTIYQARAFMHTPSIAPYTTNDIHVDLPFQHKVCLYYVNDSDGDTIFFNNDLSERFRFTPKRNTAIIFDGSIKHCASTPSKLRIVINIDYK